MVNEKVIQSSERITVVNEYKKVIIYKLAFKIIIRSKIKIHRFITSFLFTCEH